MKSLITTILLILLVLPSAFATEVDDTSTYYLPLKDSAERLDASVQRHIDRALADQYNCDMRMFGRRLGFYLTGNLIFGVVEREANISTDVDKALPSVSDSIYGGSVSIISRIAGLGPTIRLAGHPVGTDKIGHFFDMGYHLRALRAQGASIERLLGQSRWEEEWLWGRLTTGVKSYGDIAANFDGFRFWSDIHGDTDRPYFVCQDRRFKQVRAFRWADYVSAGWTESINCSRYWNESLRDVVTGNVRALEASDRRKYACPIVPASCGEIRRHYARWIPAELIDQIVSPDCR